MKQTAVNSLIEKLMPFIDRAKINDTMLQSIAEEHIAMERDQLKLKSFLLKKIKRHEKISKDVFVSIQYIKELIESK